MNFGAPPSIQIELISPIPLPGGEKSVALSFAAVSGRFATSEICWPGAFRLNSALTTTAQSQSKSRRPPEIPVKQMIIRSYPEIEHGLRLVADIRAAPVH